MERFPRLEEKRLRQLAEKEAFEVWKEGLQAWVIPKRAIIQKLVPEQRGEFITMATRKLSEYKAKDLLNEEVEKPKSPVTKKRSAKRKGIFGGLFS